MKVKGKRGWQIVQTFAGYHVRFVAGNSECIAWTEVYPEKRTAMRALDLMAWSAPGDYVEVDERRLKVTPRPDLPTLDGAS